MDEHLNSLALPIEFSQAALTRWLKANTNRTFPESQKSGLVSYLSACMPDAQPNEIDLYVSKLPEWFKISFH